MIGKIVQNYRIVSRIGDGGMGIVYLAEHTAIRRQAAIKFLNPVFLQNEIVRKKFIDEAQTLSVLQHPNIVMLYDLGSYENNIFLLMEYLNGISLDKIISGNQPYLDENLVKNIMHGVLSGVTYAHKKKIVHRDIKPSNVIITKEGVPKILDFGIAKILTSNAQKTGVKMGSVFYMSPEQVLSNPVDERTDIYSLGVTLYEMLTNSSPYRSEVSEFLIYDRIVKEDFPSPRILNQDITGHIESIIFKATEKAPEQRFQTCDEFIIALHDTNFRYNRKVNYIPSPVYEKSASAENRIPVTPSPPPVTVISSDSTETPKIIQVEAQDTAAVNVSSRENKVLASIETADGKFINSEKEEKTNQSRRNSLIAEKETNKKHTLMFPFIIILIILLLVSTLIFILYQNNEDETVKEESIISDTLKRESSGKKITDDSIRNKPDTTEAVKNNDLDEKSEDDKEKNVEKKTTQKKTTVKKTPVKKDTKSEKTKPRIRFE
ncbi:MAG: serine/threonine protein kinase [Ignavibacteria bacterium]|nr:serine/threonine protein kinase [Ignavibacteria bacterium]